MGQIFLTIAGIVIVLNMIYLLLPDGKYAKYSQLIAGLVVICVVAAAIFNTKISSDVIHFEEYTPAFQNENLEEVVEEQTREVTESTIASYLKSLYGEDIIEEVSVELEENAIVSVKVKITNVMLKDKIREDTAQYCDIKSDCVVVE